MKKNIYISLLFIISLSFTARTQNIVYQSDTTCGCDIRYVDGIETIRNDSLYGFRRADGTIILPPTYRYVDEFQDGYCRVWLDYNHCGLIDTTGQLIVPPIFDGVSLPSEKRIIIAKDNHFGYVDFHRNLIIPPIYPNAAPFTNHRALVTLPDTDNPRCIFIDTLGAPLYSDTFQNATPFSDGYAAICKHNLWGIIDTLGREIIPPIYTHLSVPDHRTFFAGDSNGLALFLLPAQSHINTLVQSHINALTPFIYQPVTALADGRIGVSSLGKKGFLDTLGNISIPCIYDEIGLFRHGRTLVRIDSLYGIIDTLGRTILPLQYHNRTPLGDKYIYHDGLALIEQNGLLGYVDLNGNIVIPLQFQRAYNFSQGLAPVLLQGHWGYIDTLGKPYLPFIFDIASPFQYGRAEVYLGNKLYIIDLLGRCVRNCNGIKSFR